MKIQSLGALVICFLSLVVLTLIGDIYLHAGKAILIGFFLCLLTAFAVGAVEDHDWDKKPLFKKKVKLAKATAKVKKHASKNS